MSLLPLFYRAAVPLDREVHRDLHLARPQRFGFARISHLVPAVVDEFEPACRHLPILFVAESHGPTPVFLTGLVPGRCALVDEAGAWSGRYLPAYLRRYPFILGETGEAPPLVCLDDTSEAVRREADAADPPGYAPLFQGDGRDTPLLQERMRLMIEYAEAARRTAAFGRTLQDLGLLRAVTVQGRDPATGESHALHGVLGVDEAALAALPGDGLLRLHREGGLAAVHAHLVSLQAVADFALVFAPPEPAGPAPAARVQDAAA
ncbi:SapC family protein [Methylobacterium oryzihabitans]|uniref:SapC family protein n=1 Tax=Methylobacterium oryzihabitans TaxID=2499852 RepID=A0A437NN88_9HYPH|nr:SapC family protein [Methylobacterium oryzihabitans]RVU11474.1 SapC family protein [Methylobacterium oryzihabitans]